MRSGSLSVEIGTLKAASTAIEESVADQRGPRPSLLDRAENVYGHDHLYGSIENFCSRWGEGIEILNAVQDVYLNSEISIA